MNTEGKKVVCEEIVDSRLEGKFDEQELNDVAGLAYKCVKRAPRKRPSMRDIVPVLSRIVKSRHNRKQHRHSLSATPDEVTAYGDLPDRQSPLSEHMRVESMDSAVDTYEVWIVMLYFLVCAYVSFGCFWFFFVTHLLLIAIRSKAASVSASILCFMQLFFQKKKFDLHRNGYKKKKVRYLSVVIRGKIIRATESTKMDQQRGTKEQKKKIQLKKKKNF